MNIQLKNRPCKSTRITSKYGARWGSYHNGVDIGESSGEPIHAAHDARVVLVRWDKNGYGNYVILQSPEGFCTLYAHLSKVLVEQGDNINSDTLIGLCGSTGNSTGPHLHFEVRNESYGVPDWWKKDGQGRRINSVDPLPILNMIKNKEESNVILAEDDANKIIKLLQGVFGMLEDKTKNSETEKEINRLANELRKVSGQQVI